MSESEEKSQSVPAERAADEQKWFLRIAAGMVFGPVPVATLRQWAEQGRVQPGNEISTDKESWRPAQTLPELDLRWYLEDSEGRLTGPFNKKAAERLVSEGRAGDGASIVHEDDADLSRLSRPAAVARAETEDNHLELDFGNVEADADAAGPEELADLRLRIEELESSKKQILQVAEKDGRSYNRQLEAERKKVEQLQKDVEHEKAAAAETARKLAAAESAVATAVAAATAPLQSRIAELEAASSQAAADLAASRSETQAALAQVEEEKAAAAEQAEKAVAEATEPLLKRISGLEADVRDAAESGKAAGQAAIDQAVAAATQPLNARIIELQSKLEDANDLAETLAAQTAADESEALQERIRSLEEQVKEAEGRAATALSYKVETEQAVANATAPLLVRIDELESEARAVSGQTAESIVAATAPLNARVAELEAALADANASLAAAPDAEKAVADATAPLNAKIAQLEADYAELLAFSNERDGQSAAEIVKAQKAIDALAAELEAAKKKAQPALDPDAADGIEQLILSEREFLHSLHEDTLRRDGVIQNRISELVRLRETGTTSMELQARRHAEKIELARAKEDLASLRVELSRAMKDAEKRDREQTARVRTLEMETDRLRLAVAETENLRQRNKQLEDTLHDRDQTLARERQQRSIDQQTQEQANQALMSRIEALEAERANLPFSAASAAAQPSEDVSPPVPAQPRKPRPNYFQFTK